MNRRGFISLLAGAAGAPLVPWRGLVAPTIFLPSVVDEYCRCTSPWCNRLHKGSFLTQESLERMLIETSRFTSANAWVITPTQLLVSPQIKHLIDTDPVVREAARAVGVRGL